MDSNSFHNLPILFFLKNCFNTVFYFLLLLIILNYTVYNNPYGYVAL